MGSSRRLKTPSHVLDPDLLDRMIKEMGAEYVGPLVEEKRFVLTKYQLTVYDCIRKNPGIWLKELERLLGRGAVNAVDKMVRLGLVRYEYDEWGKKRFYVSGGGGRKGEMDK